MKTLLKILTLVALVAKANAANTDLYFDLAEPKFNAYPASNRLVTLQLLTPFPGNLITYTSSASGTFWVSNAHLGNYSGVIKPKGNAGEIRFMVTVTATNLGTVNADEITSLGGIQTYPTAGSAAWSIQASDRRYARVGDGGLSYSPQYGSENLTNWSLISTSALQTAAGLGGALTNNDTRGWTNDSSDGLWLNNYGKLVNGRDNEATGVGAHAEGVSTIASGDYAHSEGNSTVAAGAASHADGVLGAVTANWAYLWNGDNADPATNATQSRFQVRAPGGILLEGVITGNGAGLTNIPTPYSAALTNNDTRDITLVGSSFVTQGKVASGLSTTASGTSSHAEGTSTLASGNSSHAEGVSTSASGTASHAEGSATTASASGAHAEGNQTTASGVYSHAEGFQTTAAGYASHADGILGKVSADNAYLWNGDFTSPSTNSTQYSFMVNAPGGIPLLGGVISGNGSGLTNLQASSVTTAVSNAWQNYTLFASNALYALIPSGGTNGGTATNVYFFPGNNTVWRTQNSSNVVDVVGTLTNNSSGTSTWALTAIAVTSSVTNEWRNTVIGASNTLWTAIFNSTNDLNISLRAAMTNYVSGTSNGLYSLIQVGGSATNAIENLNGTGTNTVLIFDNAAWGTNTIVYTPYNSHFNFAMGSSNKIFANTSGSQTGSITGSIIIGGQSNLIAYPQAVIPGSKTTASIVGGVSNMITGYNGNYSAILGGYRNSIDGDYASIVGGVNNTASGNESFIAGGQNNSASSTSSILGGDGNNSSGLVSAIVGGIGNIEQAKYSIVLSGSSNKVTGGSSITNTVVSGFRAIGSNSGVFVYSDGSSATPFSSALSNTFIVRAQNGVGINTNNPGGNALKVVGNVDSTVGFSVNGVSIGTANTGILTNNDTRFWTNQTGISTVDFIATGTLNVGTFNATNFNIYSPWNGALATNLTGDDTAYGSSWNGNTNVPTKNAVYDKIETLGSGGGGTTITNDLFPTPVQMPATVWSDWNTPITLITNGNSVQDSNHLSEATIGNIGSKMALYYTSYDGGYTGRIWAAYGDLLNGFVKHGIVLAPTAGTWDSGLIGGATHYRENGTNYLYYFGGTNFGVFEAEPLHIGVAYSTDGTNYTKYASNPILTTNDVGGTCITLYTFFPKKVGTTNYYGYFNAKHSSGDAQEKIHMARATNPLGPWTYYGYIYYHTNSTVTSDFTVADLPGGGYIAAYWKGGGVGDPATATAYSDDLIHWTAKGTLINGAAFGTRLFYENGIALSYCQVSPNNTVYYTRPKLSNLGAISAIQVTASTLAGNGLSVTNVAAVSARQLKSTVGTGQNAFGAGYDDSNYYWWTWGEASADPSHTYDWGYNISRDTFFTPGTLEMNGSLLTNAVDLIAGSNVTITTNAYKRSYTIASTGGGGGWTGNPNQFTTSGGQTNFKSGALVTNLLADTLYGTNSAAGTNFAILDEGGSIINGVGLTNGSVTIPGNLSVADTLNINTLNVTNFIITNPWDGSLATNVSATSIKRSTNFVADVTLIDLTKMFAYTNHTANFTITGFTPGTYDPSGTNAMVVTRMFTNNSVGAKTITMPSGWIDIGSVGNPVYNTNIGQLGIIVVPNFITNYVWSGK